MSTTYNPSNLAGPTMDAVRFRVGDVNGTPQWFLQDEEIESLLGSRLYPDGSVQFDEVCALCAEKIGAMCVQLADSVQQRHLRRIYGHRARLAFQLADRIRNNAMPAPGAPLEQGAVAGPIHRGRDGLPPEYDALLNDRPDRPRSPFEFEPY